jgi:hypothetical protein
MPYATGQRTTKVIYNSYTTQQLRNCINPKVHQGAVVFQLYNRLGDVVVERRWQLVAGVDTFQLYISCGRRYGKPMNN